MTYSKPYQTTDEGTVTERILLEEEIVFVERKTTIDAETNAQRQRLAFEDITYDHYWTGDGRSYTKLTATDADTFEQATADRSGEILERDRSEYVAIIETDDVDPADRPDRTTDPDRLVHSQLEMAAYEHVRTDSIDGTEVDIYEPTSGWTTVAPGSDGQAESMYYEDASGELAVDADGALQRSNVTLEGVEAETWGDYLGARLGDEGWTVTIEYDRDNEPADPTPAWVDDLEADAPR
ncbi:hypothetical protein D8Y22_01785 [Salinadaptatus halalkaliphilus]|uniref:Uncharacterized protein n=1 Tax=Salinadaptatus halalkaliphilus TaxID=2419781 RepID=A0A4S3TT07_9EURY|nr:hypothetical protein [Salinadaptatus halalkaliphilus]THE66553.1 hypothetical protein D8Y22_01785 [Salinadaptatus halalkaliphilus]